MKKASLLFAGVLASTTTLAGDRLPVVSDLNIKIGGYAAFESGFSSQKNLEKSEKNISANRKGFAFYNDNALFINVSNKINDFKYGAKIILVPTSKRESIASYNGSHLFLENGYGHIEAGSPIPVAKNMMISDGGIPTKYIKKSSALLKQATQISPSFLTGDDCFIGDDITADFSDARYSNEPPRTINYYTPNFTLSDKSKVQIGISYTPDSSNTGAGSPNKKTDGLKKQTIGKDDIDRFEIDRSVKDAITAGVLFEQNFTESMSLKLALTGEYGNSVGKAKQFVNKDDKEGKEYKLGNLRSYNIGGELQVNDFVYSACYGSLGKSFTTPEFHESGRNSYYYSVGTAYKYNTTTTKITYFASEQFKNKVNSVKLNVSHLLAPGLKPYVEVSSYRLKGRPEFFNKLKSRTTRGVVGVVGIKLIL